MAPLLAGRVYCRFRRFGRVSIEGLRTILGTESKSIERKQMSSQPTTYLAKLKNRFSVAERTTAFQFEKPTNFIFRPGQWIDITLLNPAETDAEGNVRGFSIASAPYEHTLM